MPHSNPSPANEPSDEPVAADGPKAAAFLHIPKTAGTSLRNALEQSLGHERMVVLEREENLFDIPYGDIPQNALVFGHVSWAFADLIGATQRATVLREPLERCVSQIAHWMSLDADERVETRDDGGFQNIVDPDKSMSWNIQYLLDRTDLPQFRALSNAQAAQIAGNHIYRDNILGNETLELATAHLESCVAIGLTENLDTFITDFSSVIGREVAMDGRRNAGSKRAADILASLDSYARSRLKHLNEIDLEFYEHAKALVGAPRDPDRPAIAAKDAMDLSHHATHRRPRGFETLAGTLSIHFFHFLSDVQELQIRQGARGAGLLDQYAEPREVSAFSQMFDPANVYATPIKPVTPGGGEPNLVASWRPDEIEGKGGASLALITAAQPLEDALATARMAMRAMGPWGALWITQAASLNHGLSAMLSTLAIQYGLRPALVIDRHVLYAPKSRVWLFQALFRAKFRNVGIMRARLGDHEILQANSRF